MRVGIVGSGMISGHHLSAAARYSGAEVVGIADPDAARARAQAERFKVPQIFTGLTEMMAAARPDVVHILTPPATHASLAVEALDGGAHVYVEKPMAVTLADGEAMAAAASRAGRQLCVGHCWLYTPAMTQARELLESGAAGDVLQASSSFSFDLRRHKHFGEGHWVTALPGGVVEDLAAHPVSLLVRLLGAPASTAAAVRGGRTLPSGQDEEMRGVIDGERGLGSIAVSLGASPDVALLDIYCSRMLLRLNLSSMVLTVEKELPVPRKLARGLTNLHLAAQYVGQTASASWQLVRRRIDGSYGVIPLIHAFYDALAAGRPAPVGPEEGLQVVRVLRAIWPENRPRRTPAAATNPASVIQSDVAGAKPALVTGASGFLGAHLVRALRARGVPVRALVRSVERGAELRKLGAEIRVGDLARPESLRGLADGVDVVYHLGSAMHGSWQAFERVDIAGTQALLDEAIRAGARRFVYAGTVSGYPLAALPEGSTVDETVPLDTTGLLGNYARAKAVAEERVLAANRAGTIEGVIVRPGLVCGAGTSVFPPYVCQKVKRDLVLLFGDGRLPVPFTYVDNAIDALILGGTVPGIGGESFNIIDDDVVTQREYLDLLTRITRGRVRIVRVPRAAYYAIGALSELAAKVLKKEPVTNRYRVRTRLRTMGWSSAKAARVLGWRPRMPLREGLRRAFESYAADASAG
ncbi:MAG TPA: NAD-dependent epimerase/dehydratase family protein [Gemmatimonadales bacterium]|nr:NAD-dependent epimerase/dehydratase family protein [Gemmatimonadales bacterium]